MEAQDEREKVVCIVSFDGGGPGSISQLLFIKELLRRIEFDLDLEEDTLRPADYWDLMGGVGFGGLCALMLGCLGLSTQDAMDELARIGNAVFPQDISEIMKPEGNLTVLRESIEAMLRRHRISIDIKLNDKRRRGSRCQVVVFAATTSVTDHCHRFRTYSSRHSDLPCTFVEAACATLSTPPYFSPVAIGPAWAQRRFVGTPLGVNNPIRQVLEEARSKFGDERKVSLVLSLGSGRPAVVSLDRRAPVLDSLHNLILRVVLDCEKAVRELSDQLLQCEGYLRLNADQGMEHLKISDWDKLGSIAEHTDVYLHRPDIETSVDTRSRLLQERGGSTSLGQLIGTGTVIKANHHPQIDSTHFSLSPTGIKQMGDIIRDTIHGITLVDAIGKHLQIPMEYCQTYSMLQDMVQFYFKHQKPPGTAFVERGDYRLLHGGVGEIVEPARWTYDVKSGHTVEMSMIFHERNERLVKCPGCRTPIHGVAKNGWADWKVSEGCMTELPRIYFAACLVRDGFKLKTGKQMRTIRSHQLVWMEQRLWWRRGVGSAEDEN